MIYWIINKLKCYPIESPTCHIRSRTSCLVIPMPLDASSCNGLLIINHSIQHGTGGGVHTVHCMRLQDRGLTSKWFCIVMYLIHNSESYFVKHLIQSPENTPPGWAGLGLHPPPDDRDCGLLISTGVALNSISLRVWDGQPYT